MTFAIKVAAQPRAKYQNFVYGTPDANVRWMGG
jgi:hypothetical protein